MRLAAYALLIVSVCFGQQKEAEGNVTDLPLRLELAGFTPDKITVPAGRNEIRVINAAVMAPITVQLDDDRAAKLAEVPSQRGAAKSRLVIVLKEGKHRISVVGREQWNVEITVIK